MKKALLATTAVVLSAGVAAADVKVSGDARFGLQYNGAGYANGKNVAVEKRLRFNFDASTTTDAGVVLGGRIRMTSNEGPRNQAGNTPGGNGSSLSGARVYAQYNGLTVAVGNIWGAVETAPNFSRHALRYTLTTLDYTPLPFDAFDSSNNGDEGIEVIYKQGPLGFHLSHSSRNTSRWNAAAPAAVTQRTAAHVSYTFSGWTVAGIVQDSNVMGEDFFGITAGGKINDFGVTFEAYQIKDALGAGTDAKFARLQGEYVFGATGVSGYVSKYSGRKASFGIGASYDLGGNARLVGGVSRVGGVGTHNTVADAGVTFSF